MELEFFLGRLYMAVYLVVFSAKIVTVVVASLVAPKKRWTLVEIKLPRMKIIAKN